MFASSQGLRRSLVSSVSRLNSIPSRITPRAALPAASAMSTAAPKKHDWLVVVPDHAGKIETRRAVRP